MRIGRDKGKPSAAALDLWYETPLGQRVLAAVRAEVRSATERVFGYHAVIHGPPRASGTLMRELRIPHVMRLGDAIEERPEVVAGSLNWPLAPASVDLVVLHHSLQLTVDPHRLLREVDQVLAPDGQLLVIGFNPFSLFGMRRLFSCRKTAPWCGRLYTRRRVLDWLSVLGYATRLNQSTFFRPPLQTSALLERLAFMERFGARCCPITGSVNLLLVQRQIAPLTPVRPRWRPKRSGLAGGVMEPTTRSMKFGSRG